jgi:hypothetical protein
MFIAGRQGTRAESFATCAGIVKAYVAVSPDSKPGFMKLRFDAPVHPAQMRMDGRAGGRSRAVPMTHHNTPKFQPSDSFR